MPWKECHVVDERVRFVARLLDGETMAALCGEFGISREDRLQDFRPLQDHWRPRVKRPSGDSETRGSLTSERQTAGSDQRRPSVAPQLGHCLQEECLPSGAPESSNGNLMSDVLQDSLVAMPAAESCRASAASDLGHQRGSEALFQHRKASPLVIVPFGSDGGHVRLRDAVQPMRRKTMTSRCSASSQPCNRANSIGSGNTYHQRQRHQSDLDANGSRTGEGCDASADQSIRLLAMQVALSSAEDRMAPPSGCKGRRRCTKRFSATILRGCPFGFEGCASRNSLNSVAPRAVPNR